MVPVPIIPLPLSGLTISDVDPRLYRNGVESLAELAAVILSPASIDRPLDYKLVDLPAANGSIVSITGLVDGQGWAYEYGQSGSPPFVTLPIRMTGQDADSLAMRIYRNGLDLTANITLSTADMGDPASPDIKVSGWSIAATGAVWVLVYEIAGVSYLRTWNESLPAASVAPPSTRSRWHGGLGAWAAGVIRDQSNRTVILRKANKISPGSGVLAASVSSGATAILLRAPSPGKYSPRARVVKGSQFTIAGTTGTRTVLVDSEAPASGIMPIVYTPAIDLGESAATGAAVTFSRAYAEVSYPVLFRKATAEDKTAIEEGQQIRLLPFDITKPRPEQNDTLDDFPILKVETLDGDDQPAYYRCYIGAAP